MKQEILRFENVTCKKTGLFIWIISVLYDCR